MANIFIQQTSEFKIDLQELIEKIEDKDSQFFLKYHNLRIENIYDFFNSHNKFFALCGFQASGKSKTIQIALNFLPENVCKIILDCSQSVCLDDILLLIHNRLRLFCEKNRLPITKPKSANFLEIVNHYFKQIKNPIIIVLNSFEHCINTNPQECSEFLEFLDKIEHIKVILSARQINEKEPPFSNIYIQKHISKAMDEEVVDTYFKEKGYTIETSALEKFYDISRGYYGYLLMTLNILKTFAVSMEEFLAEYDLRNESFDKFLVTKLLSLASDNTRNILEFLAIIRVNFPIAQILTLKLATMDEIEYLIKKDLVCVFEDSIYVKDFIKQAILKDTKTYTKYKIHKFLADFFETQLPLKPKERKIEISRQTMREEIKYHSNFVKVNSVNNPKDSSSRLPKNVANMSYVSYSKGLKNKFAPDFIEALDNIKFDKSINIDDIENIFDDTKSEIQKNKQEDIKKNESAQKSQQIQKNIEQNNNFTDTDNTNNFYEELLHDIKDEKQIPIILTKMGKNSQKLNDFSKAQDYFEKAYEIYEKNNEQEKANKILVNIADIYKDTYKILKAQNLYYQLLTQDIEDIAVKIKSYLGLIDIESNSSESSKKIVQNYFDKIFADLDKLDDKIIKSEVYFKYALFQDDLGKTQEALNFYKKSEQECKDGLTNLYLSACYSNISAIYEEQNQQDLALKYIFKALELDRNNNNLNGVYYCNAQIADLFKKNHNPEAKKYYLETIRVAKLLNDDFYIANSLIKYGDYCYRHNKNESSIKYYLEAKKYINKEVASENIKKIDGRLNDIKIRIGKNKYMNIIEDLQNNEL